jgi:membrane-associated phospholipid phosphatase
LKIWAAVLAASLTTILAPAQDAPSATYHGDELFKLPGLFWDDTKALVQTPGGWSSRDWAQAGLGATAVLGAGLLLDHAVDQAVVRSDHPSWRDTARNVAQLGGAGGLVLIGAGYLGSSWLGWDQARALWTDTGIATALARAGAFAVQVAAGRNTPSADRGTDDFRPFSSQDSFPSGHAAQAFAMASAIAGHSGSPWVGAAAYGLAGLVGLARLETRDHFTSDVLAGTLLGTAIGRTVVRVNQDRRQGAGPQAEISVAPVWGRTYHGLAMTVRF